MSRPRPTVHLFVGLHKTGSTAIRFMLDVHRDLLDRHGFHLPRAAWTQHVDGFWNGGHNNVAWEICAKRPIVPEYGTVADLVDEILRRPEQQHLVFTEALDRADASQIDRLRGAFAAFDVHVIVFVRNQLDWLRSMNAEEQKFFGAPAPDDWYRDHLANDPRVDYHAFCTAWADRFERTTVVPYEDIQSRAFDAFLACCGAPAALRQALAGRGLPLINASYGELPLALIRHASIVAKAAGVHPRYFNTVVSPAILTASQHARLPGGRLPNVPVDLAGDLFARMRTSNARLAQRFGLELDARYLDPSLPTGHPPAPAPSFSIEAVAELIAASCFEVGTRAGTRWQFLSDRGDVADEAAQIAARYHPWTGPEGPIASPLLDELLDDVVQSNAALYLERLGPAATAYRRSDGDLIELRRMDDAEWLALVRAIQVNARLNRASWNNLCEGRMIRRVQGHAQRFWVRSAPTANGELLIAEPLHPPHPSSRGTGFRWAA